MTKQKYSKVLKTTLVISLAVAVLFFVLMVTFYQHSEIIEPFFITGLVVAYHAAYRLIVGVATDYVREHNFNPDRFPFKKTALDDQLMKWCKVTTRKDTLIIAGDYAADRYNVQHYCMAEVLHIINIVLTLLSFLFCFLADGHVVAFLVIFLIALVFLAYEFVPLMCTRYARFLLTGELEPKAAASATPTLETSSAFAGLAAAATASVAAAEQKKREEEAAARKAEAAAAKAAELAEKERLAAEQAAEKAKLAEEKAAEKERLAAEKASAKERRAAEKAAARERKAAEKERLAAEKAAEKERLAAEKAAAEKAAAEKAAAEKAAAAVAAATATTEVEDISSGSQHHLFRSHKKEENTTLSQDATAWRKANGVEEPVKLSNEKPAKAKKAKAGKKSKKKNYTDNEDMSFNALASVLGHKDTDADFVSKEEYAKQLKSGSSARYGGMSAPSFGFRSSGYQFGSRTSDEDEEI